MAIQALETAEERLGLEIRQPVSITTLGSDAEFRRAIGGKSSHLVAVARARRAEILINRPTYFAEGPIEQQRTLVHEMAHLIVGRRVQRRLPAWLNEGIAMLTAGQGGYGQGWRVATAGAFGGLIPFERLEQTVAIGPKAQDLAYAQCLSITRFYLKRFYPKAQQSGFDPSPLARALADPAAGPGLVGRLWDPGFRDGLEAQWRGSQRSLFSWAAVLSGSGFLWFAASGFFLLAYWRKRRMAMLKRQRMEDQERRDAELGMDIPPWEYEADENE